MNGAGIKVGLGEVLDAAEAVEKIPVLDKLVFYYALRSAMVKQPELFVAYDVIFRQFWSSARLDIEPREQGVSEKEGGSKGNSNPQIVFTDSSSESKKENPAGRSKEFAIYSPAARLGQKKFRPSFSPQKISQTKRMVKRFKRRFATKSGRRVISSRTGEIDLARSIRKSISQGNTSIILTRSRKKITRSKIIALADVSGSMDEQSDEIYLVLYLLKNLSSNSELFVFSTELVHLSNQFSFNNFKNTAERISKRVQIWGSGTRIGECLQRFVDRYGPMIDHETTIVIISDGWDLGDPKILQNAMRLLKIKSHGIIWLNPHAKMKGYEPSCVGMKTALPYVDVLTTPEVFANRALFEENFGKETSPFVRRLDTLGASGKWPRKQNRKELIASA